MAIETYLIHFGVAFMSLDNIYLLICVTRQLSLRLSQKFQTVTIKIARKFAK